MKQIIQSVHGAFSNIRNVHFKIKIPWNDEKIIWYIRLPPRNKSVRGRGGMEARVGEEHFIE
jgi:hypothetical protein